MNATPATGTGPEELRARMVDHVRHAGGARSLQVQAALRAVPRHAFVPAVSLEEAYANRAVITKRGSDGAALSCASVPTVVALMLDQLDVRPGDRVLEIGAGTGYNAALLHQLTGPDGQVTTVDIDPEVTTQARQALERTGHESVRVITADGADGHQARGPYDRLIVTVGAWDLPPAWWDQLAPAGRLVVPLRWRGQSRSIAFSHHGDRLRSDSVELCGFVPMLGRDGERTGTLDPGGTVALHWDADQPIDPTTLGDALRQPRTEVWSGVTVRANEPFDGVWLRLTATEPGTCRIAAKPAAVQSGLCTPAIPVRSPALAEDASLAYFALRRFDNEAAGPRWELGAHAHGPAGPGLAHRLCAQIHAWDTDRTARPTITAHRADASEHDTSGGNVPKQHINLRILW